MKIIVCTPFSNHPTDIQEALLKQLENSLIKLSLQVDLLWFVCSNHPLLTQKLNHNTDKFSCIIIPDPSEDSLVLKRRYLLSEAVNTSEEKGFKWDLLCWFDADDLPTENYKTALYSALASKAYLSCLHGTIENRSYFESYQKYQNWLRVNANQALTRGENPFASGSCLIWKNTTPKALLLGESVEEKYSGVEDVCWAYFAKERSTKVSVQGAVLVRPSVKYDGNYTKLLIRKTLLREFYKQNGYKAYSQIGYTNEL